MKYPAQAHLKKIKNANIAIVAPGNKNDTVLLAELYKRHKIPYIFDFGQQITSLTRKGLLGAILGAYAVVGNDYEISLMLKKTSFSRKRLFQNIDLMITTLGPKGSIFETKNKRIKILPAKPKNESDPTGAGDAFRAGLLKGLILGLPLDKIGKLASVVSVYTVEKYGTQTHSFTWSSLQKRYYQNYKEKL
jgi:adenosine kinase